MSIVEISDFTGYVLPSVRAEKIVRGIYCRNAAVRADFFALDLRNSRLQNMDFQGSEFEKAAFVDVCFENCNFSGCVFTDAYFLLCRFQNCKAVGADFSGSCLKNSTLSDGNFSYALLERTVLENLEMRALMCKEASFAESKWKTVTLQTCSFIQNNFFKADLRQTDFSNGIFEAPTVSTDGAELRGISVAAEQAPSLLSVFGIQVK